MKRNRIAIDVALRLRPVESFQNEININPTLLTSFSCTFDSTQTQLKCYKDTSLRVVEEFLNGRNCTSFVYGQTGSGKTHTLFGPPNSFHELTLMKDNTDEFFQNTTIPSSWGIFPRIILELLHNNSRKENGQFAGITATAVEIYMDNCYDLLRDKQKIAVAGFGRSSKTSGRGSFLETSRIQRDSQGRWIPPTTEVTKKKRSTEEGYEMRGAKSILLSDVNVLLNFMRVVEATRTSKSHKLNERSSRSHCVITLTIPSISNAKYMLVDLAGSERIVKSGSIENELKANEAKNINSSLTSLGRCITALTNGDTFVPYRDSVLTMLLKQSLGGICYTSVIITATADEDMFSETIASIQFGKRCAKVINKASNLPKVNKEQMKRDLWEELHMIDAEIDGMVKSGAAGGIDPDFPKSVQDSFANNMKKYRDHKQTLNRCKQDLKSGKLKVDNIGNKKKYEESQVRNLQGILVRQMTTGVWKDPTGRYIKYVQRRIDVISQLEGMGESVKSIRRIVVPLTFDHLLIGFEG